LDYEDYESDDDASEGQEECEETDSDSEDDHFEDALEKLTLEETPAVTVTA